MSEFKMGNFNMEYLIERKHLLERINLIEDNMKLIKKDNEKLKKKVKKLEKLSKDFKNNKGGAK